MKIKIKSILKILFIILFGVYVVYFPVFEMLSKIESVILLIFSIIFSIKTKNNYALFILSSILFIINYSISFGEYLFSDLLSIPLNEVKTEYIYGITLRIILLFTSILAVFYDGKKVETKDLKLKVKDNVFIFYFIIVTLFFILFFGIDRIESDSYSVRISPIFEYSKTLFLFAFLFSGNKKHRVIFIIVMIFLFILSDIVLGGRITSIQIILVYFLVIYDSRLKIKNIILYSIIGVFFINFVSAYRSEYFISLIIILDRIKGVIGGFFVIDTATYSYYTSATLVAAFINIDSNLRFSSFFDFIISSISGVDTNLSAVTKFVSDNFHFNYGGGIIPTHFYFWFGWVGVIFISLLILVMINKINTRENNFYKLIYLAFIINSPRWLLYGPNQLFRGVFVFIPILYFLTYYFDKFIRSK